MKDDSVLQVTDLSVAYDTDAGPLPTVRHVTFGIQQGQVFGLVGESGSGKSTLARALVRYLPENGHITSGSVVLEGTNLLALDPGRMRAIWGRRITMVHQDPTAALNPAIRIGEQIAEIARFHLRLDRAQANDKARAMLEQVRIADPASVARRYAHQLSGGMLQRVLIAMALMTSPQLLILDEPTTALDVTTEAVILDLIRDLLHQYRMAVLYITHNLGVIARIADRVGVMYAGELLEEGPIGRVFLQPHHPYTRGLLGCIPRLDSDKGKVDLLTIPGYIPRPDELPVGCIFAPRCSMADGCRLRGERPALVDVDLQARHTSSCHRWQDIETLGDDRASRPRPPRERSASEAPDLVLEARGIFKYFPLRERGLTDLLHGRSRSIKAVDDISLALRQGFTLGIVGESGCGKTTLARVMAGLEEATAGETRVQGQVVNRRVDRRSRAQLRALQMVFQNPDVSLNPLHTVGDAIARPLRLAGRLVREDVERRVAQLLAAVNLPPDYRERLPHELSGGEKQRVAIARALAADPRVIICDEPISSLDVSVQASLMNLLVDLQDRMGTSYLFISHDLAAIRHVSDWIAVVYLGRLWEVGAAQDVFAPPWHPYTEALLSAIPLPDPNVTPMRIRLEGSVPSAVDIPSGCRFHTRCPRKIGPVCEQEEPPWHEAGSLHEIRCHLPIESLIRLQQSAPGAPSRS